VPLPAPTHLVYLADLSFRNYILIRFPGNHL
jgi:hypothetical protein